MHQGIVAREATKPHSIVSAFIKLLVLKYMQMSLET